LLRVLGVLLFLGKTCISARPFLTVFVYNKNTSLSHSIRMLPRHTYSLFTVSYVATSHDGILELFAKYWLPGARVLKELSS
jgi:hypothetical protein